MVEDGGPAFPIQASDVDNSYLPHPGMSLRDWLAGQAIASMLAADPHLVKQGIEAGSFPGAEHPEDFARCAYRLADAMLKERGK